jgi:hypothetical protein
VGVFETTVATRFLGALRNPTRMYALKEKEEENRTIAEHRELAKAEI